VSVVVAILLNSQGVPQTLNGLLTTGSFEGASQSVPIGPVASWESIKMFGQNGGGFFGANSAHPFENPNGVTNLLEVIFLLAVPGGAGAGFMTLVIYAILTLFLVGLMVGKTPEFIGIKISPRQVRLAVITFLVHPVLILIPTAIAFVYGHVQGILGTPTTPFGYTQALYEF